MVPESRSAEDVASGLGMIAVGVILAGIHVSHIFIEEAVVAVVIGGVVPLFLAVGLVVVGTWVVYSDWESRSTRRLIWWLGLGMTWMMVAGFGAIIYETVEGTTLSHTWYLLATFGTYGAIPGLITGFYDVQRTNRRAQLEIQEEAMDAAIDGMAILDSDGRYLYLNEAHATIYGYDDPAELVGRSWQHLYDDAEIDRFESEILPTMRSAGSWRGRATGTRKDGTAFPQRVSLTALDDGGMVCNVRDISDQVDRELAFRVLNRVLRHNLSNEVNVVVGQAERIRSRSAGDIERAASRIEEAGRSLASLAETERRIADLVLGAPEPSPTDLDSIVDPAVESVRRRYPDARIDVEPTAERVAGIPELEGAIAELVENAVAHNPAEQPWVGVAVERNGEGIAVRVRDDGPGIPEQDRKVVSRQHEVDALCHASGLGLWYVYWVARTVGGGVAFADREPEGSEVTIVLPRA